MVEVKEEYKKTFKVTLADDIRKNYSGSFSKILLALIKGNLYVLAGQFFPLLVPFFF